VPPTALSARIASLTLSGAVVALSGRQAAPHVMAVGVKRKKARRGGRAFLTAGRREEVVLRS
jgi:hypothetical protein